MNKYLFLAFLISFLSCQKAQRDEDNAVNTCEDISLAQTIYADAYKQIRIAALNAEGISDADTTLTSIYGCEEIKVDTVSNTRKIIIDYKYIGCEGLGAARYGRILADFFGKFGEEGSAVDITFSNYFYEKYEVNGTIRVIFKERNSTDQEVHTFYLQSGVIYDGSATITWTASQTWTINSTGKKEVYSFTGNSNGINRKGNSFKSDITVANEMIENCLFVGKGKLEVEVKNLSLRRLDYGNGSCDRNADVTINGSVYGMIIPQ